MHRQITIAFRFMFLSTLGLGIVFPVLVTSIGFFIPSPSPSILTSALQMDTLFQGRPSSSGGAYSGASNLSLTNPTLWKQVEERRKKLALHSVKNLPLPHDLLFASASGYDPDISVEAALYQIPRIAQAHCLSEEAVNQLIQKHIQPKLWGLKSSSKSHC